MLIDTFSLRGTALFMISFGRWVRMFVERLKRFWEVVGIMEVFWWEYLVVITASLS